MTDIKIADIQVELLNVCGSDLSVVDAARVSFNKRSELEYNEQTNTCHLKAADVKLVNYLAKHKHFSPFNHAFLSFRVKAPIFVARQLVKHKFLPWNEVSRRYVDEEPEFYLQEHAWRLKADNVKQGSSEERLVGSADTYTTCVAKHVIEKSLDCYNSMLQDGVCPEQARMVLPLNTMTEWVWSGTLGAWLDMLVLRLDPHTQKETQDVAILIADHVKSVFPVSYRARIHQ